MEKSRKKIFRRTLSGILVLLFAGSLAAVPFILDKLQTGNDGGASILSVSAEIGTIRKTLSGTGVLTEQEAADVTVPEGVTVTKYLVQNGQTIQDGDPVAIADRNTVMETISQLREDMDEIEGEIDAAQSSYTSVCFEAVASGRVKAIYAAEGESVQSVLSRYGALAVISLDGRMAAEIPAQNEVSIGETVTVVLEDGTEAEGRVETLIERKATVTIPDSDGFIGEQVQVKKQDGTMVGTGSLYVHSAWNASASGGVIGEIFAYQDQVVSSETVLFLLDQSTDTSLLNRLTAEHQEYEELLARLFLMYRDQVVTAPCDGIVWGVDESFSGSAESGNTASGSLPSEISLCTVTPQDSMTITITVDELDILSVKTGQEATVTLDALSGRSYSGTIREVNTTAANEGGNTKYSAVVEMTRDSQMLGGMNASVTIILDSREDALLIPSEALAEQNGKSVVYMSFDEKTKELSSPVRVETGLSDGIQVQILSGLDEGDVVWYSYYDKLNILGM